MRGDGYMVREAAFRSVCPSCESPIMAGERIYKHIQEALFVCEHCVQKAKRQRRAVPRSRPAGS